MGDKFKIIIPEITEDQQKQYLRNMIGYWRNIFLTEKEAHLIMTIVDYVTN